MTFKLWIKKRRINEFIVLIPFFAIGYWFIGFIWHRLLGGTSTHWLEALFWGAAMSWTSSYTGIFRRRDSVDRP